MAAHGTMSGSDRERLRQEWMQHSAQALERMFAQEQQAGPDPLHATRGSGVGQPGRDGSAGT
ncbi:MAG TPA: hypothetical protein VFC78_15480 [Tepidisphaeraceae bacterium]|nr:hypothetical protein [Tepidisphaeraceae bacterium]